MRWGRYAVGSLALLAVLAPLKFGTPVVLQATATPPADLWEWLFFAWPNTLGVWLAGAATVCWLCDRESALGRWDCLGVLPAIFLATQLVSAPSSICRQSTTDTLWHLGACVGVFYVAASYARVSLNRVLAGLTVAAGLVVCLALQQHFGGFEQTRAYAELYRNEIPEEVVTRLTSNRVFASLVSPNALAGFLVLVTAPVVVWLYRRQRIVAAVAAVLLVFCLALTGSRGGFLAFAVVVAVGLSGWLRRARWVVGGVVAVAGVVLLAQQAGLVHFSTDSVSARADYWRGAVAIARDFPVLGTGPGTFGSIYPKYKTGNSEEAQLVHNNYLQMWCDSGVAGFVAFAGLWLVALGLIRRQQGDPIAVAIAAGLAGWVVHGLVDFDLYVPGVALPAFILFGLLQGMREPAAPSTKSASWAVAGLGLAVWLFWAQGAALLASSHFSNARDLLRTDPPAALAAAQEAVRLAPDNAQYLATAADLAFVCGLTDESEKLYQAAIDRDPYRAAFHWRLATQVLLRLPGRDNQARRELARAVQLNPSQRRYRELAERLERIRQAQPSLLESAPVKAMR